MAEDTERNDRLQAELEDFRREQARVRQVLGRVGGKSQAKIDMAINMGILGVIIALFAIETFTEWIPTLVSLEIGILLVSVKIVWMIHTNAKSYHFQFWVLNSIEFRINEMTKTMRRLERRVNEIDEQIGGSDGQSEKEDEESENPAATTESSRNGRSDH